MEDESTTANTTPKENTGWIESVVIATAQTSVGQSLFKLVDSFLWVVEKSAQWSLPAHEIAAEERGKIFGKLELVRPLPWLLFLPGLVILRIIRIGLNIGAYFLGYPRIQASGMVKFVQRSRRRLRAINLKAVKTRRRMFNKDKTMIEAKKALIRSIRLTLSTLSCLDTSKSLHSPPPTKIRINRLDLESDQRMSESLSPVHQDAKRKYSEISSDESTYESETETTRAKLERLADFESADDTSFSPADYSTSSTGSSESEGYKEVSITELNELQQEAKELLENSRNKVEDQNEDQPVNTLENVDPISKNVEKTKDNVEQDVDSSGTTVKADSPKVTPEVKPEVTPEVKSGVTSEVKSGVTPEVKSEVTPEVKPEVKSEVTSEVKPEVKSEVTSEVTPEVKPEVTPEVTNGAAIEKQTPQSIPIPSSEACIPPEATARTRVNSANFQEKKNYKKKYGRYRDNK